MAEISKSAIVPYDNLQMLDLVNQVESYPEFLQWCHQGYVIERFDGGYVAGLRIKISGIEVEFSTKNQVIIEGDEIQLLMNLEKGPFKKLNGMWKFKQFSEMGSKVELVLDYEIKSQLLGKMFSKGFGQIVSKLVNDFVKRAEGLYGKS